jgi:hypothetical protein
MENLSKAVKLANITLLFDNSSSKHTLKLLIEEDIIKEIYHAYCPAWLKDIIVNDKLNIGESIVFRN